MKRLCFYLQIVAAALLFAPAELAADEDVRTKYLGSGFVLKRSVSVERARLEYEKMNAKTEYPCASLTSP